MLFSPIIEHEVLTDVNHFAVNLAVADFLVILICLPPTLLSDVTETWYMGSVMCKVIKYFQVSKHFKVILLERQILPGHQTHLGRQISEC